MRLTRAEAPVAPEVVQEIIQVLVAPILLAQQTTSPVAVREMLYDAMRVRGHFGGFYIDAISAIDIALWDLEAKVAGKPLHRLLGGPVKAALPVYVSGLAGANQQQQLASLELYLEQGAHAFKIFMAQ